jgi:hypothetical protein
MTIQANANGVATGRFTIPANIPSGTKSVAFNGSGGSRGDTVYTGSGTITTRQVSRVITTIVGSDPLAQTFTLDAPRQVAAVELCFTKGGASQVWVQIRETQTGLPNQEILAQTNLDANQINITGATRFSFPPVHLNAGQEYAIVVLTDDPDFEVAVAELGKFDQQQGWVTSQPYQVGVLLSSSNAQTWTPHQNMDLAFELLAARFTSTASQIPLGSANVDDVTDLVMLAAIERTVADSDIQITATTADNTVYRLQEDQPLNLPSRLSGELTLNAELRGTEQFSPVIYPGIQLAKGQLVETANYISRAFPSGDDSTVKVTFEGTVPGQAKVDVFAEIDGVWQAVDFVSSSPVESGWLEMNYQLENISTASVRVKLELSGNALDRPRVRRLRAITI